jgi:Calcineurin-like phosphoesterase
MRAFAAVVILVASALPTLAPGRAGAKATEKVLVAAGDISPDPFRPDLGGLNDLDTAALVESIAPDRVAPLGDNQYEHGRLEAYQHPEGYAGSWGRPAIYDLSCPVAGNHEYLHTPDAVGFQTYFAARLSACAAPGGRPDLGYYAYNLGSWRVYALNSDCGRQLTSPSCARSSSQVRWLQADLAANPHRCTLAYWHHPRWGQSAVPDDPAVQYLWRALNRAHADLVLVGHEHAYARLGAMTWDGKAAAHGSGIRQITVGTGGRSVKPFLSPPHQGTRYRNDQHFGVLKLTLRAGSWASSFHPTDGPAIDPAAASCWP